MTERSHFTFESLDLALYAPISSLEWSPSGQHIAFGQRHSIYLLDLQTGASKKLFETGAWVPEKCVSWAKNGKQFLFSMNESEIHLGSIENQDSLLLGRGNRFCWSPTSNNKAIYWNDVSSFIVDLSGNVTAAEYADGILSPDGKMIISTKEKLGRIQIANSDGSNPFFLDKYSGAQGGHAWADHIVWGPTSKQIVYSQKSDKYRIFHVDLAKPSHNMIGQGTQPKFSPDGKRILFVDADANPSKLTVSNIDGSTCIDLEETQTGNGIYGFCWSPNSDQVAYSMDNEIYLASV